MRLQNKEKGSKCCLGDRRQAILPERHEERQVHEAGGAEPGTLHLGHEVQAPQLAYGPPIPSHRQTGGIACHRSCHGLHALSWMP